MIDQERWYLSCVDERVVQFAQVNMHRRSQMGVTHMPRSTPSTRLDPHARYAHGAAYLRELLNDYQRRESLMIRYYREFADVLGVDSATTAQRWLSGETRPRRSQCLEMAQRLHLPDSFAIARAYGFDALSDDTRATIPELIQVAQSTSWPDEHKRAVVERLERARRPRDEIDAKLITQMLAVDLPLDVRAERLAALIDWSESGVFLARIA